MNTMKRILVVDDDSELRNVLSRFLSKAGYPVDTAANGVQASALYRADAPDIVLTDIYIPDKDGLETLMELRRDFPAVKVIAMSGGAGNSNILKVASALGACRTLTKPFQPAELLAAVAQVAES